MALQNIIALLGAAAAVITAVAALLKQVQTGRTVSGHTDQITELQNGSATQPPSKKP